MPSMRWKSEDEEEKQVVEPTARSDLRRSKIILVALASPRASCVVLGLLEEACGHCVIHTIQIQSNSNNKDSKSQQRQESSWFLGRVRTCRTTITRDIPRNNSREPVPVAVEGSTMLADTDSRDSRVSSSRVSSSHSQTQTQTRKLNQRTPVSLGHSRHNSGRHSHNRRSPWRALLSPVSSRRRNQTCGIPVQPLR